MTSIFNSSTLGCSRHVAYVQNKCNGRRLCELVDASEITYNRVLDDISEATVSIPLAGDATTPCCQCLADIEPWCHQLTIVREGDGVVWTGPIQKITYGSDQVTIQAKDKLAWLLYSVNELAVDYTDNTTVSLTDIAMQIIRVAVAENEEAICFIDSDDFLSNCDTGECNGIINLGDDRPPGFPRSFLFEAFAGPTAFDDLTQLGQSGIDFTVINQVLILKSEDLPTRSIGVLNDDLILGDLEITKDGTIMANRVYVRYEGDDDCTGSCGVPPGPGCPCPKFAEADTQCYGRVERIIDGLSINFDTDITKAQDTAQEVAQKYIERGSIAPRVIELPSGTRLSPDCNFGINELIPGQRIDVALTTFCFPVFQKFKLQGMSVTDNGTEEVITVDLQTVESTA